MELTPKAIAAVEFSIVRKGYDPAEVRAFLGQLAQGIEGMQGQVAEARRRVAEASRAAAAAPAAAPAPSSGVDEAETIKRTLLLAQRAADTAVAEADAEAKAILASADTKARTTVAEAEAHAESVRARAAQALSAARAEADRLVAEAREQARAAHADELAAVTAELTATAASRDQVKLEADRLQAYMADRRSVLTAALTRIQGVLDDPMGIANLDGPPAISPVVVAAAAPAAPAAPEPAAPAPAALADVAPDGPDTAEVAVVVVDEPTQAMANPFASAAPAADAGTPGWPEAATDTGDDDVFDVAGDLADLAGEEPVTAEVPVVGDDPNAQSFFQEETFADERWKPRRERR